MVDDVVDAGRRRFLVTASSVVGAAGAACAAVPFLASWQPSARAQAAGALDGIEIIIEKRVNTFGVAQPTIQKQPGANRIFVELPGVRDNESVRNNSTCTSPTQIGLIFLTSDS